MRTRCVCLQAVAGNASLAVSYTFMAIVLHRTDVADFISDARCGENGNCGGASANMSVLGPMLRTRHTGSQRCPLCARVCPLADYDVNVSIPVCEGLDYTSNGSSSPGFAVACNQVAGLGAFEMPCVT